jgi:hypothetical protein
MTAFSGVRISWLMLARKTALGGVGGLRRLPRQLRLMAAAALGDVQQHALQHRLAGLVRGAMQGQLTPEGAAVATAHLHLQPRTKPSRIERRQHLGPVFGAHIDLLAQVADLALRAVQVRVAEEVEQRAIGRL